jgi:hypothetical protein
MRISIASGLVALGLLVTPNLAYAQSGDDKPLNPMTLLKDMSSDLGGQQAFSFETTGFFDEQFEDQMIKRVMTWSVSVVRPNRMAFKAVADDGEEWFGDFDGTRARVFYALDKEYAEIPFEGNLNDFVDFADASGLTKTPINDFLRTDLYGDIEEVIFDALLIDGYYDPETPDELIHHVLYQSPNTIWQLWVRETEENYVPHRSVVTYTNRLGRPEFANQFRNWSFSVDIDAAATAYGIPKSLDGWTKVEFENPLQTN